MFPGPPGYPLAGSSRSGCKWLGSNRWYLVCLGWEMGTGLEVLGLEHRTHGGTG